MFRYYYCNLIAFLTTFSIVGISGTAHAITVKFFQTGWDSGSSDIVQGSFTGEDLNNNGFLQFNSGVQEITAFNLESINTIPELSFTHSLENLSLFTYDISNNLLFSLQSFAEEGDPNDVLNTTSYGGGTASGVLDTLCFVNNNYTLFAIKCYK